MLREFTGSSGAKNSESSCGRRCQEEMLKVGLKVCQIDGGARREVNAERQAHSKLRGLRS